MSGRCEAPLPCPFCGSANISVAPPTCTRRSKYDPADRAYPVATCLSCYARVPGEDWDKTCKSVVDAWNRRTPPPADIAHLLSEVARLEAAVGETQPQIEQAEAKMLEWRKAMQSLTPGGSEFMTPAACLDWLREMKTGLIEGRIAAERAKQEADRTIARLSAEAAAVRAALIVATAEMKGITKAFAHLHGFVTGRETTTPDPSVYDDALDAIEKAEAAAILALAAPSSAGGQNG